MVWAGVIAATLVIVGVIVLFAADLDNVVGWRTHVDLSHVQALVGDLVGSDSHWTASHHDELWRTFVECRVHDGAGVDRRYYWEVTRGRSPRDNYDRMPGIFVTPLTRETARLAPKLLPEGLSAERLPERPDASARALFQDAGLAPAIPLPVKPQS